MLLQCLLFFKFFAKNITKQVRRNMTLFYLKAISIQFLNIKLTPTFRIGFAPLITFVGKLRLYFSFLQMGFFYFEKYFLSLLVKSLQSSFYTLSVISLRIHRLDKLLNSRFFYRDVFQGIFARKKYLFQVLYVFFLLA